MIGLAAFRWLGGRTSQTYEPDHFVMPPPPLAEAASAECLDLSHRNGLLRQRAQELLRLRSRASPGERKNLNIVNRPLRIVKGQEVKQIQAFPEFDISFNLQLDDIPPVTSNVLAFSLLSPKRSFVPSISVLGGTTQLVLHINSGAVRVELLGPEVGLELNKVYAVSVRLQAETLSFDVSGCGTSEAGFELRLPPAASLKVFVGHSCMEAAPGWVDRLVYCAHHAGLRAVNTMPTERSLELELPPAERRLLAETERHVQKNEKWALFDALFGVFLVANSILIGFEIEFEREGQAIWKIFDNSFIIIFTVELVLRIRMSRFPSCRVACTNPWIMFDTAVILFSMLETWLLSELPAYVGVLRLLRLLKLAKMVRLVRAFRELGVLVEGLLRSFRILLWTFVLMLITLYIGAILMVRTAKLLAEHYSAEDREKLSDFLDVPRAMWRLLQMATFDKWAESIREIAFGLEGIGSSVLAVELLLFTLFVGLGIMNMVVGILCNTAFALEEKNKRTTGVELLLRRQAAMMSFKQSLRTWGERPLFQSDRFIGTDELLEIIAHRDETDEAPAADTEDEHGAVMSPAEAMEILGLRGEDVLTLCETFAEDGSIEIDGLIEALQTKELQRYFGLSSRNWLKKLRMTSQVRPADMVSFDFSVAEVERHLLEAERSTNSACTLAYDALCCLHSEACKAIAVESSPWRPPKAAKATSTGLCVNIKDLEHCITHSDLQNQESKIYMPIDVVFGIFICANVVFIGVQISMPDRIEGTVHTIADCTFTSLFCLEFAIRASLFAHMNHISCLEELSSTQNEITVAKLRELQWLRASMFGGILPPLPPGGCWSVCMSLLKMLSDPPQFIDFLIILVSVVDSVILIVNFRRAELAVPNASILSALRVFRLCRLAKLLRIFRVFPYLQMLIFALFKVWKTVLWGLLLMLLVIYAFSIYAVVVYEHVPELQEQFGSINLSFIAGWRLATFDDWGQIVEATAAHRPRLLPVLFLLLIVLGLGLMKIIVGIMSESAISLLRTGDGERRREELIAFIREMARLHDLFEKEFHTDTMPQEFIENALGIHLRPKRSSTGDRQPLAPELMEIGKSRRFANQLLRIFRRAKLSSDLVKQVFEKVDYQRRGYVSVDAFANGAIVMKEDLTKVQLYACIAGIQATREVSAEVQQMFVKVHQEMEAVLCKTSSLTDPKKFPAKPPSKPASLARFSQSAGEALAELGVGLDPTVIALGRVSVVRGKGRLRLRDGYGEGVRTDLRNQVKLGDFVLVQPCSGTNKEQVLAFRVSGFEGHERLKFSEWPQLPQTDATYPFLVARQAQARMRGMNLPPDIEDVCNTHTVSLQSGLSPRSAQIFLDWELGTQRRHDPRLQGLLRDRLLLGKQLQELTRDVDALWNRALAQHVFNGFRAYWLGRMRHDLI